MSWLETLDLSGGAVLTIATPAGSSTVIIELDGDCGLLWAAQTGGRRAYGHRAEFGTTVDRDAALRRTVGIYLDAGYTLTEEA